MSISIEDIKGIAASKNLVLITAENVNTILSNYASEQEQDPTATWDLVVDNMIDKLTMSPCSEVHPNKMDVCYGSPSHKSACKEYLPEEEPEKSKPLCAYCLIRNGKGYCELSGKEEP